MAAGLHHPASTWHYNTDKPGCGTSAYQDFRGRTGKEMKPAKYSSKLRKSMALLLQTSNLQVVFIELFLFSQNWVGIS